LKFDEKSKPPMKVDTDPLDIAEASYVEPLEIRTIEAMDLSGTQSIPEDEYIEKIKVVYPRAEEDLIDFLSRCKINNHEVMMCPRCSAVCDKEATAGLENYLPYVKPSFNGPNRKLNFHGPNQTYNKGKAVLQVPSIHQRLGRKQTFVPSNRVPVEQWGHGRYAAFNKKVMHQGGPSQVPPNMNEGNKFSYSNNYKGKNPMTRTQWRRYQRQQKLAKQNASTGGNAKEVKLVEKAKRPAKERISSPLPPREV
jgi:hypothetical protein